MPRTYRSELVQAIYAAVGDSAPLVATLASVLPGAQVRVLKDNRTSRIIRLTLGPPGGFPVIQVRTGNSDSGDIFPTPETYQAEADVELTDDVRRQAEVNVELLYDANAQSPIDDAIRDQIETHAMAAVAGLGPKVIDGLGRMTYRRTQRIKETMNGVAVELTRIVITANFIIEGSATLPD
ncbi:MAG TPA: hypothetical protein VGN72_01085 [Tepidisphaeraceae bacterium]|jgi:hypothetical protein|nr:hypothetical protein [Tepidisphaeraceae bacterium]